MVRLARQHLGTARHRGPDLAERGPAGVHRLLSHHRRPGRRRDHRRPRSAAAQPRRRPLSDTAAEAASRRHITFVQTNLDEQDAGRAEAVAADLYARLHPETVVVTLGRPGALGYTSAGAFRMQARQIHVRHTHGAGAAFSDRLAHAYLTGATARQAVHAACLAGTSHCAATGAIPHQRTDVDLIMEALS
ncbi:PfkB family carbohydrate kinase [Phytohabitans sp. LJ34]|uniref:PfkB family carbohydrate kinase n=1 Tax=Phytohabitans sp. LJ34 TaxID=3452217 RepID=UPI003F8B1682